MSMIAASQGSRLAYVVVPIKEKVTRNVTKWEAGKGLFEVPVEEDGGFMVYFPRGHVLRLTKKELKRYGIDKKPRLTMDMNAMFDPDSSIGKVFLSQSSEERALSWKDLERQVIQMATVKTGNNLLTKVAPVIDREEWSNVA